MPTGDFLFEPKWDGFRAIVFRDAREVLIQSRDGKPLDRYFPELHDMFLQQLPRGCMLDGEIVVATPRGLDFDALAQRVHPAASRVARLAGRNAGFLRRLRSAGAGRPRPDVPCRRASAACCSRRFLRRPNRRSI